MLPKDCRLNLKKDFTWAAKGKKLEDNLVKLFIRGGDPSTTLRIKPKVGIAVSKANFKKAVDRNRARRLVSKGFEDLYHLLPQGLNIVVLPKKGIINLKSDEVVKDLESLLKKGGVIK